MKPVATNPILEITNRFEVTPSIRWVLSSLSLTMLLSSLGTSIANVGLPSLASAFNTSFQAVQWVVLAYLLAITTLIVSVGRLGDLMGRRRLMMIGLLLFTSASAVCALAPYLVVLIAARALQGVGAAMMMSLTMAFVSEVVPKEKTGRAMGLLGTMSAVGTALGPSLGGLLIYGLGWRSIFLINIPLGLLAVFLAYRFLPNNQQASQQDRSGFDLLGSVLLACTLGAYALAMTLGQGSFTSINVALLFGAAVGVLLFILAEAKVKSPLVRLQLFSNPLLSAGFATSTLVATVIMATLVVGPFYLSGALALNTAKVGLIMAAGPVVAALLGMPLGRVVDRFGPAAMTLIGLFGILSGTALLALIPASFGIPGYLIPLLLITASYALFQVSNNTSVMANIGSEQPGLVSAMLNLSRNLGLITGASVMGAIFAFASATTKITEANPAAIATGMHQTFAVAAALMTLAIIITYKSNAHSSCSVTENN